jgi:inhibitor of cysteine peptidase
MRQPGHAIRILSLLSLLLAFHLMLVAQQASPAPVKLTDADNNKSVQFALGQRIEIRLSANPTTGYSWLLQGFPGCLELANFSYTSQGKSMPGGGGTQTVEFLAASPGEGELKIAYRRPWEKSDVPAAKTFSVKVTVSAK